jgi:predicted protein tyrosine phosphatase/membrane-associated phospholipid phosphatase
LCVLFLVVYGGTNWLTSLRSDVRSFHFDFERRIPFVAAFIVPYLSIDLFFIAAPFLCRDDRERRWLAMRLAAAVLVAGTCFLIFPLRFAFERPHSDGVLGVVFDHFRRLDQPFNQFPSLHIALQIILLPLYVRRTRGVVRAALIGWFALIAASTVLTYQHHLIDIVGGVILGAVCIAPLPVGALFLIGACGFAAAATVAPPWTLVLLWPASALAIVAAGYFHFGHAIYCKRDGRLPLLMRILLWPVLVGQRASLAHYARQCNAWDALTDRVWIGRRLSDNEAQRAIDQGVIAVLDLTGELDEAKPFLSVTYRQLAMMDLTAPTRAQLDEAIAFIREHESRGFVYVHCKAGYSRTAAVAGGYLLATGEVANVEEAVAMLKQARPPIVIRPEAMRALADYGLRMGGDERAARMRRSSIVPSAAIVSTSQAT